MIKYAYLGRSANGEGVCTAEADGEAVIFSVMGRVRGLAVICNLLGNKHCLIGSRMVRYMYM